MRYRNRTSIIASIIGGALEKTSKTRLMHKSYLSYDQFKEYVPLLEETGLIARGDRFYVATESGRKFLSLYNEMRELTKDKLEL